MSDFPPLYPDNDPRSWNYHREYTRPKLHALKVILYIITVSMLCCALYLLCRFTLTLTPILSAIICCIAFLLVILMNSKHIVIWCVHCYQHFAPVHVRSMCRFEPSCSEYMIMAVDKYGTFKGCKMGINRVWRCAHKDGGFDYP